MKDFHAFINEADAFKSISASDNIVRYYIGQAKSALQHVLSDDGARIAHEELMAAKSNIRKPSKKKFVLVGKGADAKAVPVEGTGDVGTDPSLVAEVERLMRVVYRRLDGGVTGFGKEKGYIDPDLVIKMTLAKFMEEFDSEHPNATKPERKAVEAAFRTLKDKCRDMRRPRVGVIQANDARLRALAARDALEAAVAKAS